MTGAAELKNKKHALEEKTYMCIGEKEERMILEGGLTKYSTTVIDSLEMHDTHSKFFSCEEDLKYYISADVREDMFYTLKRRKISRKYPARFLYILDFLKEKGYSFNEIFKYATVKQLLHMSSALPDGVSLEDIIRNHYDDQFKILYMGDRLRRAEYTEVRVQPGNGRIAFIANNIADKLSDEDILEITVQNKILMLGKVPVACLGGSKYGVSRGTYDLRRIL